jgi:ABC-type multidrug transport system fused ATPase/permease subunit
LTAITLLKKLNTYMLHVFYIRNKLPSLPVLDIQASSGIQLKKAVLKAAFLADLRSIKWAVYNFSNSLKDLIDAVYEYGEHVVDPVQHLYSLNDIKPGLKRLHGPQQLYTGREELQDESEKPKGMSIEFKEVTFTYPESKIPALSKVSFRIEAGEVSLSQ